MLTGKLKRGIKDREYETVYLSCFIKNCEITVVFYFNIIAFDLNRCLKSNNIHSNVRKIKITTYKLHTDTTTKLSSVIVHAIFLVELVTVRFNCVYKICNNVLFLHWNRFKMFHQGLQQEKCH